MIELNKERLEKILREETAQKEELQTILRSVYTRYMRLYEKYFADIDALNDEKIAELRAYHEETVSLVKHFYLDIPMDVCTELREFEEKYSDKLLGPGWREYLHDSYEEFKEKNWVGKKSEAEFKKQILSAFYDAMDYIFREDFGTSSQTAKKVFTGLTELLFGKES
ncbi:MAG: hypothetical protein II845_07615 [Oscillospiraceae bacterium]|nr:hypothetical protein [Oscillospiraceae bacterium]